ncbi:MAG TPA: hypothetical protein VFN51_03550 [Candidatus Saccharimonadales bacterium]|nr:hypothetical protein [Candidatus Saccharimonadales bacterium]
MTGPESARNPYFINEGPVKGLGYIRAVETIARIHRQQSDKVEAELQVMLETTIRQNNADYFETLDDVGFGD